jgi:hypothetical protein
LIVGEYLLQWAVNNAFLALAQDPENVADMLANLQTLDPAKFDQACAFFSNAKAIPVFFGWPDIDPARAPVAVGITLNPKSEDDQFIGGDLEEITTYAPDGSPIEIMRVLGVRTRATYNLTAYGINQDLVIWVSQAIWWGLLKYRDSLTEYGLVEQRLSQADVTLDPRFPSSQVMRRITALSLLAEDRVTIQYTNLLRDVGVEALDYRDPQHPFLNSPGLPE